VDLFAGGAKGIFSYFLQHQFSVIVVNDICADIRGGKIIYLFICSLFNDAVSTSDYITSNNRTSEKRIERDGEGKGRGQI
jgi:hypothetical protein